jgi:hypothetical protein
MNKTVVTLLGIALLIAPAIPSFAQADEQGEDRPASSECPEAFEGDHWSVSLTDAPGLGSVVLAQHNVTLADAIQLPGEDATCEVREDRLAVTNDEAKLRMEDSEELRVAIQVDGDPARIEIADGVGIETADEGYRLTTEGPTLQLVGEDLTRENRSIHVGQEAQLAAAPSEDTEEDTEEDTQRSPEEARAPPSEDANRSRSQGQDGESDERPERGRSEDRADRQRRIVTEGEYAIGAAELRLANETVRRLTWNNDTVLRSVDVPGLTPAEEHRQGPQLRLDGEDARLRLNAAQGLMVRIEADEGFEAQLADGVEVDEQEDHVKLATDQHVFVLEGDNLAVDNGTVTADELRLNARGQTQHEGPTWKQGRSQPAVGLPHTVEGRYVSFEFTEQSLSNLSVHGTPLGEVTYEEVTADEIRQRGASFRAEGDGFELRVQDAPAAQLRLEAPNLRTDLSEQTTLPSGAQVHVDAEDDELRIRVERPADALANETIGDHRAPTGPVEAKQGPQPGLETRSEEGQLGITSSDPNTITTSFDGDLDELDTNISVELGLARAMLIDDTNGNNRVDVGEPALADRPLRNGTVSVENDTLVHRFPLWSGNLTVTVEPGEDTAKITYAAEDLDAPPGTLFVLETHVEAPEDADLTPTDTGVVVDNGTMRAEYSATGPVLVDGEEAWAQRSIFVDGDDRVRVLTAYPAGDDIEHDPTVAVQSAAEVAETLAASPYAIAIGVGLAGVLVAGSVIHRRRKLP